MSANSYSVPKAAAEILQTGILQNPLLAANIPANAAQFAQHIEFTGTSKPSLPINWRFAESISALKGLEAIWLNALLETKYKQGPVKAVINT